MIENFSIRLTRDPENAVARGCLSFISNGKAIENEWSERRGEPPFLRSR